MASQHQQPGESDRDYIRRLAQQSAQEEQERKDRERQESLDSQAEAAAIREALGDEVWLDQFAKDVLEMSYGEVEALMAWADANARQITPKDRKAVSDIAHANRGIFRRTRNRRIAKALKRNKGSIKRIEKKKNSWFGCAVIAVALLGVGGGALWGLFEAGSALVTAMVR